MGRAKVYRHIERRPEWLGLEPIDALLLGITLWLLLTFHRGALALNCLVIAIGYAALRLGKRGKPAGYTLILLRYVLRRRAFLSAAAPDHQGRASSFPLPKE